MSKLYASPFRVYLILASLALAGVYSGFQLPVSLFPNSSKPHVWVNIAYGSQAPEEFLNTFGKRLESQLRKISTGKVEFDRLEADYNPFSAEYKVQFKWGVAPQEALREVQNVVNAFTARLPEETRDSVGIWLSNRNSGFFALSFYSESRSLDDLYDLLEPILTPKISKVEDAQNPVLWNPSGKEIRVQLIPDTIAALQLFPRDIESAISSALSGTTGGAVTVGPTQLVIQMPRQINRIEDLSSVTIPTPAGKAVHLSEIAHIDFGPKTMDTHSFKTNGAPSLMLHAVPKPGGNVKQMSEDLLAVVKGIMPSLPKDVKYRVLVDPSEFIRSAVNNVFDEVAIAALLAVAVLFLFIGSFRNVITAAIEIPLSMVLAFILMRMVGMNLNLISLGGLALSAGMNVDASVVVMENIFRHFEASPGPHDLQTRIRILTEAVKEVRFAIIASTIASLVVFLPLTFTSDLSYAILGDLAKAVVFSHGFSAFVALILVPTVRLHLMSLGEEAKHKSPIEGLLVRLQEGYASALSYYINRPRLKWATYGGLTVLLGLLAWLVLPRLPKEIVGTPDTDWMVLAVNTDGNTILRQMEEQCERVERDLLERFGDKISYTFTQVSETNSGTVMARLKDKKSMRKVWKAMEAHFTSTPLVDYWVGPWNPSELPIPDPPQMRIAIRGGDLKSRMDFAKSVSDLLREKKVFPQISAEPSAERAQGVFLTPHVDQWTALRNDGARFSTADLADQLRVATTGRRIGLFPMKRELTDIVARYPSYLVNSVEDIGAFPIGIGSKIVPLKALAEVRMGQAPPTLHREDEQELFLVNGRENMDEKTKGAADLKKATALIEDWKKTHVGPGTPTVTFEEPAKDLTDAIHQLGLAVGLSILMIFLTLLIQFGTFAEPLLVLISVPLGFIGVLLSLWVFQSTLSLNSILGVILLNGIAVANSIILVDFIKRLVEEGATPKEAALDAARKRIRPILITSLTTVLGMLPIAFGMGEGGRILQPLGIAVSGGLWVSMGLTLFLVPAMQVSYLEWKENRKRWAPETPRAKWRIPLLSRPSNVIALPSHEVQEPT